ncbi:hypothetical protein HYV74_01815 [Candidatus Uhrbacteria bacterium]|nr:hypothetical protein [Candidatus Uhrbacteria bacterium]
MDSTSILAWFAAQEWPLTEEEVRQMAGSVGVTDADPRTHDLRAEGFLWCAGREHLPWLRHQKSTWAWKKWRRARRWARVLACFPFLRMVAVANALGYGNARIGGDIDLFLVVAPRRMWIARLGIVAALRLFRQRPGEHAADALCPSFFVTTDALCLADLQLADVHARSDARNTSLPPDPYLLWWAVQLTVLWDRDHTYERFWHANAAWVQQWLPCAALRSVHPRMAARPACALLQRWGEWLLGGRWGDALEHWARRVQERRLPEAVRVRANQDTCVVVRADLLKLHTTDRRMEYRDRWHQVLRAWDV